ncbi:MAG: DMT family transporter [Eubacteriaceae bacterium]|jgi:drug/metabolite transporter (DMT)-like permease|nr:DMT family transporter [Eubacteriaceae bacterium]
MEKTNRSKMMLVMVCCAVMWSTGGVIVKLVSWNPLCIAGARGLPASLVLLAYLLKSGHHIKINRYTVGISAAVFTTYVSYVVATKMTTAANAIVIQYLAPVWVVVISAIFLHEKFTKTDIAVVAISTVGIMFFFFDKLSVRGMVGNMFALLAGIALALLYILNNRVSKIDPNAQLTGVVLGQALTMIAFPVGLCLGTFHTTGTEVLMMLGMGLFQLGLPYIAYLICQRSLTALTCSLIGMIEPLLNPVWVLIFYGERPGPNALIGGSVIIITLTLWCIWQNRQ